MKSDQQAYLLFYIGLKDTSEPVSWKEIWRHFSNSSMKRRYCSSKNLKFCLWRSLRVLVEKGLVNRIGQRNSRVFSLSKEGYKQAIQESANLTDFEDFNQVLASALLSNSGGII